MEIRDAWVEIDRRKLEHNFLEVRHAVGSDVKICAVLKAQCYGMSGPMVAGVLAELGADAFAVAVLSEAVEVRSVVPNHEILVLGYVSEAGYDCALDHRLSLTMYQEDALRSFTARAAARGEQARVHIKVNSGMNRLGFSPTEESADVVAACMALPHLSIRGIFTHLAAADEADSASVSMQVARFDGFLQMLRDRGVSLPTVHIAASPTVCRFPELDRDMVRPGLLLTGYYTSEHVSRQRIHLLPCVKVKARLGNILSIQSGEGVSYGFTYRAPRDMLIGLLPIGFSDGLTRMFSNRFYVTIRGYRCPVIGSICMDHCMIDLSEVPHPQIGEEIVVYGDGIVGNDGAMNIEEVAQLRGTIVDEVLTNLAARLPRRLV